jgi:GT2 family glycosyltransferase
MEKILSQQPTVAVVIVTWNSEKDIADCLKPLLDLPDNWEVWVSDNDSKDHTVALVQTEFPRVKVLENKENLGFAKGCNRAIEQTKADYVLLLNPDTVGDVETFVGVLELAEKEPKLGALSIKIFNENGEQLTSCFPFPSLFKNAVDNLGLYRLFTRKWLENNLFDNFFDHQSVKRIDWTAGCFILLPRGVVTEIGNLPEDYFVFGEDIDLCYKIWQAGYEVIFYPDFGIVHKGSQSVSQLPSNWRIERTTISKYAFCFKYYGALKGRLIQFSDYFGFLGGAWWLAIRKPDSPLREEWKMYRKVVGKSLKMSYQKMLDLLNNRLD